MYIFYDFVSPFSIKFPFRLRRYIKRLGQSLLNQISNTSKFVKNASLRVIFSTLSSVFGNVVKHGLPSFDILFKGANRFSGKRAGPGQVKLSLKIYHVKAN